MRIARISQFSPGWVSANPQGVRRYTLDLGSAQSRLWFVLRVTNGRSTHFRDRGPFLGGLPSAQGLRLRSACPPGASGDTFAQRKAVLGYAEESTMRLLSWEKGTIVVWVQSPEQCTSPLQ